MDFPTAVRTCLSKYVDFTGRARRSEYWWFVLFGFLVGIVTSILDGILGTGYDDTTGGVVNSLGNLALLLPSLAVGVRRLHDIGKSGWWLLLWLIPIIGWIILIVWFCKDSDQGSNEHGPSPKEDGAGYQPGQYPPPPPPTGTPYGG